MTATCEQIRESYPTPGVTSLTKELGRDVTVHEVLPHVEKHLVHVLG